MNYWRRLTTATTASDIFLSRKRRWNICRKHCSQVGRVSEKDREEKEHRSWKIHHKVRLLYQNSVLSTEETKEQHSNNLWFLTKLYFSVSCRSLLLIFYWLVINFHSSYSPVWCDWSSQQCFLQYVGGWILSFFFSSIYCNNHKKIHIFNRVFITNINNNNNSDILFIQRFSWYSKRLFRS